MPLRAGYMRRIRHARVHGRDVHVLHPQGADAARRVLVCVAAPLNVAHKLILLSVMMNGTGTRAILSTEFVVLILHSADHPWIC